MLRNVAGDRKICFIPASPESAHVARRETEYLADQKIDVVMPEAELALGPELWQSLARQIGTRVHEYAGFIVGHWRDAIPFTGTALAYVFGTELGQPVVLADVKPDFLRLGALRRLELARVTAVSGIKEVVAITDDYVHRACRTYVAVDARKGMLKSGDQPLAMLGGEFKPRADETQWARRKGTASANFFGGTISSSHFSDKVLLLNDSPAAHVLTNSWDAEALAGYDAVVVSVYRRLDSTGERGLSKEMTSLIAALQYRVPVVLTTELPPTGRPVSKFSETHPALLAGGIPTGDCTWEAAFVKAQWVAGCLRAEDFSGTLRGAAYCERFAHLMAQDRAGELNTIEIRNLDNELVFTNSLASPA